MAMGIQRGIMAFAPLIMDPKKKIRAKTRGMGIGRLPKKAGSSWITPVEVMISLNIMIKMVLKIIMDSKAERNMGLISSIPKRSTNTLITATNGVAAYTGMSAAMIRTTISRMDHRLRTSIFTDSILPPLGARPVAFGSFLR